MVKFREGDEVLVRAKVRRIDVPRPGVTSVTVMLSGFTYPVTLELMRPDEAIQKAPKQSGLFE